MIYNFATTAEYAGCYQQMNRVWSGLGDKCRDRRQFTFRAIYEHDQAEISRSHAASA